MKANPETSELTKASRRGLPLTFREISSRRWWDPYLLLVLLLSLFAVGPLLQPGYFWGAHDARHSVYFLFEFDRSIQDGIWYPRWSPDFAFGYGYPFFNIYGPLAFYVGEALHLLGLDLVSATKAVFALSIVLSGLAMYLFVRRIMGRAAGLVAALTFVYVPYHIVDIYVRGALAESFALIFIPLTLWAFYETVERPGLIAIVGAGLAYAGLMFAHNGLALLFSPFLGLYLIFLAVTRIHRHQPLNQLSVDSLLPLLGHALHVAIPPLSGLLLGLGLSGIFWLPMATEYKFVRTDQWLAKYYDYRSHFTYFFQLFSPHWGFGISQAGPHDDLSLQLGVVPTVLSILSLAVAWRTRNRELRRQLLFFQAISLGLVLLTLPISAPTWEVLRLVTFAQFPWRILTLTTVSMAFLAGSVLAHDAGREANIFAVLALALLIIMASYNYLTPEIIEPPEGPPSMAGLMTFQQSAGEMTGSTAWVREIPQWSTLADHYMAGLTINTKLDFTALPVGTQTGTREFSTTHEKVEYLAEQDIWIIFNTFYYPGWRAYLLDKDTEETIRELEIVPQGTLGRMSVLVPAGWYVVLIRFEETPVRVLGKYLSLGSLLLVVIVLAAKIYLKRKWTQANGSLEKHSSTD
ncbi:MAG: 6-pyruvoyl-tetrahydropterin synthase-related protein [Anaerolineae bacterium]